MGDHGSFHFWDIGALQGREKRDNFSRKLLHSLAPITRNSDCDG